MKKLLVLLSIIVLVLAACGRPSTSGIKQGRW